VHIANSVNAALSFSVICGVVGIIFRCAFLSNPLPLFAQAIRVIPG
jgi:hypothetical protein